MDSLIERRVDPIGACLANFPEREETYQPWFGSAVIVVAACAT
jgi:hypothetical protein